jgi:hypothetical protein
MTEIPRDAARVLRRPRSGYLPGTTTKKGNAMGNLPEKYMGSRER